MSYLNIYVNISHLFFHFTARKKDLAYVFLTLTHFHCLILIFELVNLLPLIIVCKIANILLLFKCWKFVDESKVKIILGNCVIKKRVLNHYNRLKDTNGNRRHRIIDIMAT